MARLFHFHNFGFETLCIKLNCGSVRFGKKIHDFIRSNSVTTRAFPCVLRRRGVARQNLFGDWIVKKTWGSAVRLDYGRSNSVVCSDYQTGLKEYQKQQIRRRVRGYEFLSI